MAYDFNMRIPTARETADRIRRDLNRELGEMLGEENAPGTPPVLNHLQPIEKTSYVVDTTTGAVAAEMKGDDGCVECGIASDHLPMPPPGILDRIRYGIERSNREVNRFLKSNHPLKRRYEETIWYATFYEQRDRTTDPHQVAAVKRILERRIPTMAKTIKRAQYPEFQIAAAVVMRMLPRSAFMVGDATFVDDITADLAVAVANPDSLEMRYQASLTYAHIAKMCYGREKLVNNASVALIDTMDAAYIAEANHDSWLTKMIAQLDTLLDHGGQLSPQLKPSSAAVVRSIRIFHTLGVGLVSEEVQTAAITASKALNERLIDYQRRRSGSGSSSGSSGSPSGNGMQTAWRRGINRFGYRCPGSHAFPMKFT